MVTQRTWGWECITLLKDPWWMWQPQHTTGCVPEGSCSGSVCRSPCRTEPRSATHKSRWRGPEGRLANRCHRWPLGRPWTRWRRHFELNVFPTTSELQPWLPVKKNTKKKVILPSFLVTSVTLVYVCLLTRYATFRSFFNLIGYYVLISQRYRYKGLINTYCIFVGKHVQGGFQFDWIIKCLQWVFTFYHFFKELYKILV